MKTPKETDASLSSAMRKFYERAGSSSGGNASELRDSIDSLAGAAAASMTRKPAGAIASLRKHAPTELDEDKIKVEKQEAKKPHRSRKRRPRESSLPTRVPLRPFPAPAAIIDMTQDAQYELKWRPLPRAGCAGATTRAATRDPYEFIYDRRALDRGLFDDFQTQGERLEGMSPAEVAGTS